MKKWLDIRILLIAVALLIFFWFGSGVRESIKGSISTLLLSPPSSKASFEDRTKRERIPMDDPEMISVIRQSLIHPQNTTLRNLPRTPESGVTSQMGEDTWVDTFLKGRTNGFFVECGAYDGERVSNTVFFELKRNWTGLLIESSTKSYIELAKRKRHVYSIHACLSPFPYPKSLNFTDLNTVAVLPDFQEAAHAKTMKGEYGDAIKNATSAIMCYPFYSIMLAIGQTRVDFFSLDIEGPEIPVLRTIPFDKIYIEIIMVEFLVWGSIEDGNRKLADIRKLFNETGLYREVGLIHHFDVVFQHI